MPLCACRRSDFGKRHRQPESELQVACVRWARGQGLLVCGQAGGAAYLFGGRTRSANALKARGMEPGTLDLFVLEPGFSGMHGLAVELKIGDNDLSDAQRAWFTRARAKGWRCEVVKSLQEFVALVHEHQSGVIVID